MTASTPLLHAPRVRHGWIRTSDLRLALILARHKREKAATRRRRPGFVRPGRYPGFSGHLCVVTVLGMELPVARCSRITIQVLSRFFLQERVQPEPRRVLVSRRRPHTLGCLSACLLSTPPRFHDSRNQKRPPPRRAAGARWDGRWRRNARHRGCNCGDGRSETTDTGCGAALARAHGRRLGGMLRRRASAVRPAAVANVARLCQIVAASLGSGSGWRYSRRGFVLRSPWGGSDDPTFPCRGRIGRDRRALTAAARRRARACTGRPVATRDVRHRSRRAGALPARRRRLAQHEQRDLPRKGDALVRSQVTRSTARTSANARPTPQVIATRGMGSNGDADVHELR